MPWSASEHDSAVDSRKPRMRGMAIKKDRVANLPCPEIS